MPESIQHFGAIRMRINGQGNVIPTFIGFDNVTSQPLVPIPMSTAAAREPTRLSNFVSQRAQLELKTTQINEVMKVNRIIIFVKDLWENYPG